MPFQKNLYSSVGKSSGPGADLFFMVFNSSLISVLLRPPHFDVFAPLFKWKIVSVENTFAHCFIVSTDLKS